MVDLAQALYVMLQKFKEQPQLLSEKADVYTKLGLDEYQRKAAELICSVVRGRARIPTCLVIGPPGTGKTATIACALSILNELYDKAEFKPSELKIVYLAPTNELVAEAFARFVFTVLVKERRPLPEILTWCRAYGSQVRVSEDSVKRLRRLIMGLAELDPQRFQLTRQIEGRQVEVDDLLRRVIMQATTDEVRFIFATDFQRVSLRFCKDYKVHILVDEAGRTEFYRPFLSIADAMTRAEREGRRYFAESLVVVGDPEQAISIDSELKHFRDASLLLATLLRDKLTELGYSDYVLPLSLTYRVPYPTNIPSKQGFYRKYGPEVFNSAKSEQSVLRILERSFERNLLRRLERELPSSVKDKVVSAVESLTTSGILSCMKSESRFVQTYERSRIKVATCTALVAAACIRDLNVMVTAPYLELVTSSRIYAKMLAERSRVLYEALGKVSFSTVHAALGREADMVVTMLGKEDLTRGGRPTIYFMEPEVLNVQLTRHRCALIIVGNLDKLRKESASLHLRYSAQPSRQDVLERVEKVRIAIEELCNLVETRT